MTESRGSYSGEKEGQKLLVFSGVKGERGKRGIGRRKKGWGA